MPKLFKVEEVLTRPRLTRDGRVTTVLVIRYRTVGGLVGEIEVEKEKATKEYVEKLLTEEAQRLEDIRTLEK